MIKYCSYRGVQFPTKYKNRKLKPRYKNIAKACYRIYEVVR